MKELRTKLTEVMDPRRVSYGNIRHKLDDIVIIELCTVILWRRRLQRYGSIWLRTRGMVALNPQVSIPQKVNAVAV